MIEEDIKLLEARIMASNPENLLTKNMNLLSELFISVIIRRVLPFAFEVFCLGYLFDSFVRSRDYDGWLFFGFGIVFHYNFFT